MGLEKTKAKQSVSSVERLDFLPAPWIGIFFVHVCEMKLEQSVSRLKANHFDPAYGVAMLLFGSTLERQPTIAAGCLVGSMLALVLGLLAVCLCMSLRSG